MCHALDVEEFLLFLNKFHRALALLRGRPFDARGGGAVARFGNKYSYLENAVLFWKENK